MKNLKLFMMLLILVVSIVSCSKKDDNTDNPIGQNNNNNTSNTVLRPGTLTITINGDGYTDKTITYVGQVGNQSCLWCMRYLKDSIHGLGPDHDYSFAMLYYNPPKYNATSYDSSSTANGLVALRVSGKSTLSNDPWSMADLYTYRGIMEFSFKPNATDKETVMYMIEDGVTVGHTTITEYGSRVKGTFEATKMQKLDFISTTPIYVNIKGSFDLEVAQ